MGKFEGKVVLVTGGASGFGAATVRRFAEKGASVVAADINAAGAQAVASDIGDQAIAVTVDVRESASVKAMIAATEEAFGGLDILVNNAGLCRPGGPVEDGDEDDFDLTFAVNVKGVWLGMKHGVPALRRRGGGVILNTASVAALVPRARFMPYGASKSAVVALTLAGSLELAPDIRVNCVCPASADTPFMAGAVRGDEEAWQTLRKTLTETAGVPLGRLAEPADVAKAFTFLASDDAGFVSGAVFPVDGARSAG